MLDIPEVLIIALTALLAVLWTRHWISHHQSGRTKKQLQVMPNWPMEPRDPTDAEGRLDDVFREYRAACPIPETSVDFTPNMWARIEAREVSRDWFGRVAKALVIAALAVSVILGMMVPSINQSTAFLDATFVEALRADHASNLEPLHLDRIAQLDSE